MRSLLVVVADPGGNGLLGLVEGLEVVEPGALFLQAAEETLDHAVLLGRVRGDELLAQLVVTTSGAEAAGLEDEPVVAAQDGRGALGA